MKQCLMDQKNGVVDDNADQNNEPQHGQHVERLKYVLVEQRQTAEAARGGDGHRQQNDQRIDETLEQDRHHQVNDDDGEYQIEDDFAGIIERAVREIFDGPD